MKAGRADSSGRRHKGRPEEKASRTQPQEEKQAGQQPAVADRKTDAQPANARTALAAAEMTGFAGSYRKSDNPDVLYGRDFEDEPMPIEQIHGRDGRSDDPGTDALTVETREIRIGKTHDHYEY